MRKDRLLYAFTNMKTRCYNPNNVKYPRYGGRGIKVCEQWQSFRGFAADMGPHPGGNLTLERLDVNGDYTPENCVWATPVSQAVNRHTTQFIEYKGLRLCIKHWAKHLGVSIGSLYGRASHRGGSILEAIKSYETQPLGTNIGIPRPRKTKSLG